MGDVPQAPEPDDKDWTWVVQAQCPECGFDGREVDPRDVAGMIRANARDWQDLLGGDRLAVTTRPELTTWSASEYGAHVRDVFALYDHRLDLMLTQDDPLYPNWDQDQTAIDERYDLQDPAAILPDLLANAERLASAFDAVEGDQWERRGRRSDGASFTVETFATYLVHDPVHHVHDARTGLATIARSSA